MLAAMSDYELVLEACRQKLLTTLPDDELRNVTGVWHHLARPNQLPPAGDWSTWLIMAGRGFGKTRAGAEWVRGVAEHDGAARIALVGASLHDARSIMVEGESGLLAVAPADWRPQWLPSLRELRWPNGARAQIFGAADPETLRGPQHSHGWADEIGKWPHGIAAWDNLAMGMRLGSRPRIVATTTPRATPLVVRLAADPGLVVTRGRTRDNDANLPAAFLAEMERGFAGTRLGRQELDGELLLDIEGALWTRALIEQCRHLGAAPGRDALVRVVVGVDPPARASGDACGIVAVGRDRCGMAYVLEDATIEGASPERWARRVAETAARWQADRVVAEANNGGDMVAAVLRAADIALPVKMVHASRGKTARAEPVAALYEAGHVRHAANMSALEDQLCGLTINGVYEGPGRSPDRADALVWALTEISLSHSGNARLRSL
ncbi:MAG: DNA-packaging protein [Sphingobium sp.]|nr:DNA-packaging protein [Sphingobium sp.]